MKVDSRSFTESICTPESKSICGRGGRHKLLLFWNPNAASVNGTPFRSCPSFLFVVLKQQNRTHFHCLNKMNKKLGTRIPDCLVRTHEPE
jgi:hypothetical protein